MEASPKLSTILEAGGDHGKLEELPEPYTHYLDRISCKEGYRAGVYWTSGDHYCGEWHENKRHGKGMHTYQNGNRYEGEWKNGKKDGHGTFWIKSGRYYIRKYKGKWKENQYGVSLMPSPSSWPLQFPSAHFTSSQRRSSTAGKVSMTDCLCRGMGHTLDWEESSTWASGKEASDTGWVSKPTGIGVTRARPSITCTTGDGLMGSVRAKATSPCFKNDWKEGMGVFYFKDKQSKYEGLWRNDSAVSGLYSRNMKLGQPELPFVMVPSCEGLNKQCLKLAASQPLPQRYDKTTRRTDPALCTRKFYNVLYKSPLLD
uniref:MORN repeat-containing protein 3 n=1 Tax=Physcomitrium patens TaxID=3218 RepID=A0A7I4CXX2_PHYPA